MKNQYRCSCCNELKSDKNIVYKKWDAYFRPSECSIVGICRTCNLKMKKVDINRVEQFLEAQNKGVI